MLEVNYFIKSQTIPFTLCEKQPQDPETLSGPWVGLFVVRVGSNESMKVP